MKQGCDQQKITSQENRKKILSLLEQNNSVEQHIFYQNNAAPEQL